MKGADDSVLPSILFCANSASPSVVFAVSFRRRTSRAETTRKLKLEQMKSNVRTARRIHQVDGLLWREIRASANWEEILAEKTGGPLYRADNL
jgi:hypothetical protein